MLPPLTQPAGVEWQMRTPLVATRTSMDRIRAAMDERRERRESAIVLEGKVTVWARRFSADDPRSICAQQVQEAKKIELAEEEARLETLLDMGCCGCCGVVHPAF